MSAPLRRTLPLTGHGIALSLLDFGGTGRPALLCHAAGFCAALWTPVAEALRETHRVFAYDARGHGHSDRPDPGPDPQRGPYRWSAFARDLEAVSAWIAQRCAQRPALLVGHSFGGTVALACACAQPGRFHALALIDPVLTGPARVSQRSTQLGENARKRRSRFASRDEIRARYAGRLPFAHWDPGVFELYLAHGFATLPDDSVQLRCPPPVEAAIYGGPDLDGNALATGLRCPALLLRPTQSDLPRARAVELARSSERVQLEEVEAGHLWPLDAPQAVAERLRRFATA